MLKSLRRFDSIALTKLLAQRGWVRGFYIGVGVLAVIFAIMIILSPFFGAVLAGFIMGIILLIIGTEMIAGIGGKRDHLRPPRFKRNIIKLG